jgi:glycerol dehydrogenase
MKGVFLPRYHIGADAYDAVPTVLPADARVFLIGGARALSAGRAALESTGINVVGVRVYGGPCSFADAEALADEVKTLGASHVAGMGGGKAIDIAKACGHFARLPVFAFPTIAATCAAVTKLSVMYHPDGAFDRFLFLDAPPVCAFIHTGIIAAAPAMYLRAGMGDATAKHFESVFAARGDQLGYEDGLGVAVGKTCYEPLLKIGPAALLDCARGIDSDALRTAVSCAIVSAGIVSLTVQEMYNGAVAHSLFYAMENLPQVKNCLHGDVVAWGVLVQLMLDGDLDRLGRVRRFLVSLGIDVRLADMGMRMDDPALLSALADVPGQPDMRHLPYPVTAEMVLDAVSKVEVLGGTSLA